jgi:hypothetical protein
MDVRLEIDYFWVGGQASAPAYDGTLGDLPTVVKVKNFASVMQFFGIITNLHKSWTLLPNRCDFEVESIEPRKPPERLGQDRAQSGILYK